MPKKTKIKTEMPAARPNSLGPDSVAFAAHQLRSPLTSTRWFLELLESPKTGKLNATQRRYVQELKEINASMRELVDVLMDIARLGTDEHRVAATLDLPTTVRGIIAEFTRDMKDRRLKFAMDFDAVSVVVANPALFRMILWNFLSNAIKYTPRGGSFRMTARRTPKRVLVSVTDTGPGIPAKDQARIFEKFFRANNGPDRDVAGTGLGLYLSKAVADMQGWDIGFESAEGKGSTFHVAIPNS